MSQEESLFELIHRNLDQRAFGHTCIVSAMSIISVLDDSIEKNYLLLKKVGAPHTKMTKSVQFILYLCVLDLIINVCFS